MPRVSVLMPVYNTAPFLRQAIESLLAQTLDDLELIVIDDASSDESWDILSACAAADQRIIALRNEKNLRQAGSLNRGLEIMRGQYVTRQDSDDLSQPGRLAALAGFLDEHPAVVIVGSAIDLIDPEGRPLGQARYPLGDAGVQALAVLRTPFTGASVMMRSQVLRAHGLRFDPAMVHGEDYDLCSRCLRVGQGANLAQALMLVRMRPGSDTDLHAREQEETADKIALANWAASPLREFLSAEDILLLRAWAGRIAGLGVAQRHQQISLLKKYLRILGRELGVAAGDLDIIRKKLAPQYLTGLARIAGQRDRLGLWAALAGVDPWGLLSLVGKLVINKFR
ncbi:MAG: glycosyltransferase family 2 protein [Pseudomonadota bacterium]